MTQDIEQTKTTHVEAETKRREEKPIISEYLGLKVALAAGAIGAAALWLNRGCKRSK